MEQIPHDAYSHETAPRDYSGNTIQKSHDPNVDPYGCNENNYFRTWQLPQRTGRSAKNTDLPPPPYNASQNSNDPRYRHVEHVYESPKFDRREIPQSSSGDLTNGSAQYFELDPDAVTNGNLPHGSQTNPDVNSEFHWLAQEEQPEVMFSTH